MPATLFFNVIEVATRVLVALSFFLNCARLLLKVWLIRRKQIHMAPISLVACTINC